MRKIKGFLFVLIATILFGVAICFVGGLALSQLSLLSIGKPLGLTTIKTPTENIINLAFSFKVWLFSILLNFLVILYDTKVLKPQEKRKVKENKPEELKSKTQSKEMILGLGKRLNSLLSELSEFEYEEESDFDYAYEEAMEKLDKILDKNGHFKKNISIKKIEKIIEEFEEVKEYETEV
jgi:hypothetical protein